MTRPMVDPTGWKRLKVTKREVVLTFSAGSTRTIPVRNDPRPESQ